MCFSFFVCFLSPLVWFFLWLPEEVLALLFLLHRENGDFSILIKDTFSGLLNHECGDFSILVRVIYLMSMFNIVEGSYRTN